MLRALLHLKTIRNQRQIFLPVCRLRRGREQLWPVKPSVQGGSLPRLRLVQLRPGSRRGRGLAHPALIPALSPHVTPIKADIKKEKTMTVFDFALVINALAHVFHALATLISMPRRRRKRRR
jgi:hypothetical protein